MPGATKTTTTTTESYLNIYLGATESTTIENENITKVDSGGWFRSVDHNTSTYGTFDTNSVSTPGNHFTKSSGTWGYDSWGGQFSYLGHSEWEFISSSNEHHKTLVSSSDRTFTIEDRGYGNDTVENIQTRTVYTANDHGSNTITRTTTIVHGSDPITTMVHTNTHHDFDLLG